MQTDALQRRLRFAPPQATKQRIDVQESDYLIFEAINKHGVLPATYLFQFVSHLKSDYTAFQHRLTDLYNGDVDGNRYLDRPPQQWDGFEARYQPIVYSLTEQSKALLAETNRLVHKESRGDPFLHQLMNSTTLASLALASENAGLGFLHKHQILKGKKLELHNGLARVVPDNLFALIIDGKTNYYAVEIDRATESIERKDPNANTFGKKILAYQDLFKSKPYRKEWEISHLNLLTITTNATHIQNILKFVRENVEPRLAPKFLFKAKPQFGAGWRIPPIMSDLLNTGWLRADGSEFFLNKA